MAQWLICRLHFGGESCNAGPARWKIKVPSRGESERDEKWILRRAVYMRNAPQKSSPNSCPPRQINYPRIINNLAGRRKQTSSPACAAYIQLMLNAHSAGKSTKMRVFISSICGAAILDTHAHIISYSVSNEE